MRPRAAPRQVVVITGASSGIGLATALLFAGRGWGVGLIARNPAGLAAAECTLIERGARVCQVVADVADDAALAQAADIVEARLGPIDVWVNAAGNGVFGELPAVPAAEFDRVTATTYTGTVNGVRAALRRMVPRNRGTIVNICSAMAYHGLPGLSSYAGAKAAVRGFTQSVQAELKLARSRIRLAIVFPPAVNTPFFAHAASHLPRPPRPARPVYQPELVAQGVWLAAHGRDQVRVGSITVLFDLASRLLPGPIGWAVARLGYEGQMTDLPAALAARDPCLFGPGSKITGTRGPFPARESSVQLWLSRHRRAVGLGAALAALAVVAAKPLGRRPYTGA